MACIIKEHINKPFSRVEGGVVFTAAPVSLLNNLKLNSTEFSLAKYRLRKIGKRLSGAWATFAQLIATGRMDIISNRLNALSRAYIVFDQCTGEESPPMVEARMLNAAEGSYLVALRVAHHNAGRCAEVLTEANRRLSQFDGFKTMDIVRREGPLGVDFYIIARFRNLETLEKWKSSDERRELSEVIESLSIADVYRQQVAEPNIWFEPIIEMPTTPQLPPFWKRWATNMLAVYPALVLLIYLLKPVTELVPDELGFFIIALILTGLTTAFIGPFLASKLHRWLIKR